MIIPNTVKVREYCNIAILFSLDISLPDKSSIIFRFRGGRNNKNDWYFLQPNNPSRKGFAKLTSATPIKFFPLLFVGKDLQIKFILCNEEGIAKGTKLKFEVFNTLAQSIAEQHKKIEILVEIFGVGYYKIENPPCIRVCNEKFDHATLICPSIISPGERFRTLIRIEDVYNNIVEDFNDHLSIVQKSKKGDKILIQDISIEIKDKGLYKLYTTSPIEVGLYELQGKIEDRIFISNIFEIRKKPLRKKLYWGYIHGHTNKSDGMLDLDDYFNNLKKAGLDFGTSTEHDHLYETTNDDFKEIKSIVKKHNKEGDFISIFAYEYGSWYSGNGDICIYHFNENVPIFRSEMEKYDSVHKLIKSLLPYKKDVLLISHHSALRPGFRNWDYFNNEIERLVEIYSTWGNQEYSYVDGNPLPPRYKFYGFGKYALKRGPILERKESFIQDALKKGYKLGFTAGGDDHYGFYPSGPIDPDNGLYPSGIMAVWAENLKKRDIWNAFITRKTYGSTGPRIIIEFYLNNFFMGEIIRLKDNPAIKYKREIKLKLISPNLINKIEIVRNNEIFKLIQVKERTFKIKLKDSKPINEIMLKHSKKRELFVFYYVRVFMKENHMAWASPIWIISELDEK
ncbi:MAG: DUF3604 domain-containing protein [Promethearchaeota archaeon]